MLEKLALIIETHSGSKYQIFSLEYKGKKYWLWKRKSGTSRIQDTRGIFLKFLEPVRLGNPVKFSYVGPDGDIYVTKTSYISRIYLNKEHV